MAIMIEVMTSSDKASEESRYLRLAREGDHQAFITLLRLYDLPLRQLVGEMMRDRDRMDDVLQDAYLKAYSKLDTFNERSSFGTWLYRIAHNCAIDNIRRHARVTPLMTEAELHQVESISTDDADIGTRMDLDKAIESLAPEERAVVVLVECARPRLRERSPNHGHQARNRRLSTVFRPQSYSPLTQERQREKTMTDTHDESRDNEIAQAMTNRETLDHGDGFFDRLDAGMTKIDLEPHGHSRRLLKTIAFIGPTSAAAAILVAVTLNATDSTTKHEVAVPPSTSSSIPASQPPATEIRTLLASDVVAKANASLEGVSGISGKFVNAGTPGSVTDFIYSADGSYRLTNANGFELYNSSTGNKLDCVDDSRDGTKYCNIHGNLDPVAGSLSMMSIDSYASAVRAVANVPGGTLEETMLNGRAVWKTVVTYTEKALDVTNFEHTIYVDKETGFPTKVIVKANGKTNFDVTVKDLVVNPTFDDATFSTAPPKGANVSGKNAPANLISLGQVKDIVGYEPVTPKSIPPGFALSQVTARKVAESPNSDAAHNTNVVTLTYRKGLSSFTVTTRSTGKGIKWTDPIASGGVYESIISESTANPLDSGPLASKTVHRVISTRGSRIWGIGDHLVITVSGDIDTATQLEIVKSLS